MSLATASGLPLTSTRALEEEEEEEEEEEVGRATTDMRWSLEEKWCRTKISIEETFPNPSM